MFCEIKKIMLGTLNGVKNYEFMCKRSMMETIKFLELPKLRPSCTVKISISAAKYFTGYWFHKENTINV